MIDIENMEVTDATDAGTGLMGAHEGLAEATEDGTPTEAQPEATGEAGVDSGAEVVAVTPLCETEDASDCVWDAQVQGNGVAQSFVDVAGVATEYDYTDVFDDLSENIDCDTQTLTSTFTQVVVGFKNNPDGTTTMVDLGNTPEVWVDEFPMTRSELAEHCNVSQLMPQYVDGTVTLDCDAETWTTTLADGAPEVHQMDMVADNFGCMEVVVSDAPYVVDSPQQELAVTGAGSGLALVLVVASALVGSGIGLGLGALIKKIEK